MLSYPTWPEVDGQATTKRNGDHEVTLRTRAFGKNLRASATHAREATAKSLARKELQAKVTVAENRHKADIATKLKRGKPKTQAAKDAAKRRRK